MMFKFVRQRKSSMIKQNQVIVEDLSNDLVPILGSRRFAIVLHNFLSPEECTGLIRRFEGEDFCDRYTVDDAGLADALYARIRNAMRGTYLEKIAFTPWSTKILSPEECTGLIRHSETKGIDDAMIQESGGEQVLWQDVRPCGSCMVDDADLADALYARIRNALRGTDLEKKIACAPWLAKINPGAGTVSAVGLNERMQFQKYGPGHFFAPNQDPPFVRSPDAGERAGETSYVAAQLYLSEKFKGGETRFLRGNRYYDVRPRKGSVLIFDHDILRQEGKVMSGIKHALRTEVMFTQPQYVDQVFIV